MSKKMVRECITLFLLFSVVAIMNIKWNYFVIPVQNKMVSTQSNLFTICSVFAGFSFSMLGVVMAIFSDKLIEKLEGTTLIQRKCERIVQSIIFFCLSGFISLIFILGFNIYFSERTGMGKIVDNVMYINGIGFLFWGLIYFMLAVINLFEIIEKIYGFDKKTFSEIEKRYQSSKEKIKQTRNSSNYNEYDE